jgi:REP element-mobilizing transposase RayT
MRDYQSLAHTAWDCKYHIVFIPKGRKKAIFGAIRHHLGQVLHELAQQKECKIVEGHLMRDHVHICISIPPKHSVSYVVGYIKGNQPVGVTGTFPGGWASRISKCHLMLDCRRAAPVLCQLAASLRISQNISATRVFGATSSVQKRQTALAHHQCARRSRSPDSPGKPLQSRRHLT